MNINEIKVNYELTETEAQKVFLLKELFDDDIDGIYSMLKDEDIFIEFEDLNQLVI